MKTSRILNGLLAAVSLTLGACAAKVERVSYSWVVRDAPGISFRQAPLRHRQAAVNDGKAEATRQLRVLERELSVLQSQMKSLAEATNTGRATDIRLVELDAMNKTRQSLLSQILYWRTVLDHNIELKRN